MGLMISQLPNKLKLSLKFYHQNNHVDLPDHPDDYPNYQDHTFYDRLTNLMKILTIPLTIYLDHPNPHPDDHLDLPEKVIEMLTHQKEYLISCELTKAYQNKLSN